MFYAYNHSCKEEHGSAETSYFGLEHPDCWFESNPDVKRRRVAKWLRQENVLVSTILRVPNYKHPIV